MPESTGLPLVALGGWGMPASLMAPFLPRTGELYVIVPGLPPVASAERPEQWLERLLPDLPERALWVGWSLGGALAMLAARQWPQRVSAVVTLCSTPCFVARPDWSSGMPVERFEEFSGALARDAVLARKRFMALTTHGDSGGRDVLRTMKAQAEGPLPDRASLEVTLAWLRQLDLREAWLDCPVACRHVLGARDPLVGAEMPRELGMSPAHYRMIEGMAHWPGSRHAAEVGNIIHKQWEQAP